MLRPAVALEHFRHNGRSADKAARGGAAAHKPVPYTTMITLPAGASPDGLVLVTVCPKRGCLPTTVNPSSSSASRALVKVMPTTSGTGTSAGAVEAGAL